MASGLTRSGEWIQSYLEHLAMERGQAQATARQRIHRLWADAHPQHTGCDCGFFAASRIPQVAAADWRRVLHTLNRCSTRGHVPKADCVDLLTRFTQEEANAARAHLREQLRDRAQTLAATHQPGWEPGVAPGRWRTQIPTWRTCGRTNREILTADVPQYPDPTARPLADRSTGGIPLTEQDLARLYTHDDPRDSYLNDTIMDWMLCSFAREDLLPSHSLTFTGRFIAKLMERVTNDTPLSQQVTRSGYNRVKRWTGRNPRTETNPLERKMLFFLDNATANHWRLIAVINPSALLAAPAQESPGQADGTDTSEERATSDKTGPNVEPEAGEDARPPPRSAARPTTHASSRDVEGESAPPATGEAAPGHGEGGEPEETSDAHEPGSPPHADLAAEPPGLCTPAGQMEAFPYWWHPDGPNPHTNAESASDVRDSPDDPDPDTPPHAGRDTHAPWECAPAAQMEAFPYWWCSGYEYSGGGGGPRGGSAPRPATHSPAAAPLWGREGTLGQVDPELAYMASTDDGDTPCSSPSASPHPQPHWGPQATQTATRDPPMASPPRPPRGVGLGGSLASRDVFLNTARACHVAHPDERCRLASMYRPPPAGEVVPLWGSAPPTDGIGA